MTFIIAVVTMWSRATDKGTSRAGKVSLSQPHAIRVQLISCAVELGQR